MGLVSWGRDRAAVLEPLSVVAFDGAAFDLDDENARVGDGDDEVAFAFAVGADADAEGVPGRPAGGEDEQRRAKSFASRPDAIPRKARAAGQGNPAKTIAPCPSRDPVTRHPPALLSHISPPGRLSSPSNAALPINLARLAEPAELRPDASPLRPDTASPREFPMLYDLTITQFTKTLQNLSACLDKAAGFADAKKIDADVLLGSRLAVDQFNLLRQIQIACDTAKAGAARLTGKEAPVYEDQEKTVADVKARIENVVAHLQTFSASDFVGAETRQVSQPRWAGKSLTGHQFALHHMVPNFFFHVTTAYSILRHSGVELGKRDYLGAMPYKEPAAK